MYIYLLHFYLHQIISLSKIHESFLPVLFCYTETETQTCSCGRQCTLFKREEMVALRDAATSFELEKNILLEVQRHNGANNILSKTFFHNGQERIQDNKVCFL